MYIHVYVYTYVYVCVHMYMCTYLYILCDVQQTGEMKKGALSVRRRESESKPSLVQHHEMLPNRMHDNCMHMKCILLCDHEVRYVHTHMYDLICSGERPSAEFLASASSSIV